jgi:hypothetical protein
MSALPFLNSVISFLMTVPTVGPVLIKVLDILLAAAAIITPLVGVWRAVVALMQAAAKVPGLGGLSNLAAKLTADDNAVEGFVNNTLLPIVQDLSLISIPSSSGSAPAQAAAQAKAPDQAKK